VPLPKPLIYRPLHEGRCRCRIRITYSLRAEMGGKAPFWAAPDSRAAGTAQENLRGIRRCGVGGTAKRRYWTRAGLLMTIPRSGIPCRRARPECRGRTLRLRLVHSIDAAAPTANDDSSAASTAPVEENPYAIPITTPRMFPAIIQPIIVSRARTRLSQSATA
jgi:hypothetical protein